MAREIVLDANVIVAQLDGADSLATRAQDLTTRLRSDGSELVLLDFVVQEALSVLCRRSRERKTSPPDLSPVVGTIRHWSARGAIRWSGGKMDQLWPETLDVIEESAGRLNFNDSLLVVLQRSGAIGDVASFDKGLDIAPGFRRLD
jgi:predicted nucleic acid-binding protein